MKNIHLTIPCILFFSFFSTQCVKVELVGTAKADIEHSTAHALAIQADGKIAVAGQVGWDKSKFLLARYYQNGIPDKEFGEEGVVTTQIENHATVLAIAIQSDGKIIVAGSAGENHQKLKFAMARYNKDGILDESFGTKGIIITKILEDASVHALAIQANGKIVVAGRAEDKEEKSQFTLARYEKDGKLDESFGTNGIVTTQIENESSGNAIKIQNDGKIIVAGTAWDKTDKIKHKYYFALARYHKDGKLDESFGTKGIVTTQIEGSEDAEGTEIAIQPDDKIVLAGYAEFGRGNNQFAIARYSKDGKLDESFGDNGVVMTSAQFTEGNHCYWAISNTVAIQFGGKIIIASHGFYDFEGLAPVLVQYDKYGKLDKNFGEKGNIMLIPKDELSDINTILIDLNKKLFLVAGSYGSDLSPKKLIVLIFKDTEEIPESEAFPVTEQPLKLKPVLPTPTPTKKIDAPVAGAVKPKTQAIQAIKKEELPTQTATMPSTSPKGVKRGPSRVSKKRKSKKRSKKRKTKKHKKGKTRRRKK